MGTGIQIQNCGHQRSQAGRMMALWTRSGTQTQAPKADLYNTENPGMGKWITLGQGFLGSVK